MRSFDEFRMGDALWEYMKSKRSRNWESEKREDIAAEAREEEGAGYWENFNPWENLDDAE